MNNDVFVILLVVVCERWVMYGLLMFCCSWVIVLEVFGVAVAS